MGPIDCRRTPSPPHASTSLGSRSPAQRWWHGSSFTSGSWPTPSPPTADSSSSTAPTSSSTKVDTICSAGSAPTLGLWGGTLLQWLVPFLLATYFFRPTPDRWLCILPVLLLRELALHRNLHGRCSVAIASAGHHRRSRFRGARLLCHLFQPRRPEHDTQIAAVVRVLGWCGMLACVAWLASRSRAQTSGKLAGRYGFRRNTKDC